jgi:hypothetical protein
MTDLIAQAYKRNDAGFSGYRSACAVTALEIWPAHLMIARGS